MDARAISVGTKVELELYNGLGSKLGKTYSGEFMEIESDMDVVIFSPSTEPLPISFSDTISVKAVFHHKMHGMLNFKGTLIRKEKQKVGIKFYIKIDDSFKEMQKREYFRPDCFLNAEYRLYNEEEYKKTITKNISYTGVCILVDVLDGLSEDCLIELKIWLKNDLSINLKCKILRIMNYEVRNKIKYEIGLIIEEMNENDKELLIKYITRSVVNQSLYLGESPFNF